MFKEYLNTYNVNVFDLLLVAIIGLVFGNLIIFIFKKTFSLLNKTYIKWVQTPFKEYWEERKFNKRVKQFKITDIDLLKIGRKKREGTVTKEQIEACEFREKERWDSLSVERKEEIIKQKKQIKDTFKNF